MKKFTSIFLLMVFMIPLLAQKHNQNLYLIGFNQNQFFPQQPKMIGSPTIKLDSVIINRNYTINSVWATPVKKIYEYDNNFRLQQITEKTWHQSKKEFGITGRSQFFYNAQGLIDSIFLSTNALTYLYSYKYLYDKSGKLKTVYNYTFSLSKWELSDYFVFSYNNLGKLDVIDTYGGIYMQPGYILKFNYNNDGNLIEFIRYFGIYIDDISSYEWDKNGNLISEIYEEYMYGGTSKTEHFYNSNGDRIKSNFYSFTNTGWLLENTLECTYCDLNCSELVNLPIPPDTYYNPIEYTSNKLVNQVFQTKGSIIEKSTYYYSPIQVSSGKDYYQTHINVYPNPATDKVTFTWNQETGQLNLKLFSITGKCMTDIEISSNENVDVSGFPPGIYLYRLLNKNEMIKTGKLVVE